MARAPIGGMLAIEAELAKERASALRRVGHQMERLSERLQALRPRLETTTGRLRSELLDEYRTLHAEAHKQRWYLIVQREAMGLYHHGDVDELYPIPPPYKP